MRKCVWSEGQEGSDRTILSVLGKQTQQVGRGPGRTPWTIKDKEAQEGAELWARAWAERLMRGDRLKSRKDSWKEGPAATPCISPLM